jgi:hypothetical protein
MCGPLVGVRREIYREFKKRVSEPLEAVRLAASRVPMTKEKETCYRA